jgi:hypothetical protein
MNTNNENKPYVGQIYIKAEYNYGQYGKRFSVITRVTEKTVSYASCNIEGRLTGCGLQEKCNIANIAYNIGSPMSAYDKGIALAEIKRGELRYKMRLTCEAIIKALYNSNKYQVEVLPPQLEAVQNILEFYKQQANANANL